VKIEDGEGPRKLFQMFWDAEVRAPSQLPPNGDRVYVSACEVVQEDNLPANDPAVELNARWLMDELLMYVGAGEKAQDWIREMVIYLRASQGSRG
jgi:predicted alpha-1,6-mannanase (GH76 family)